MSSKVTEPRKVSKAELKFREAFERLKAGKPDILPKGTPLSQNNVAKEAGVDPSALRRARFPELVADIQSWIETHKGESPPKIPTADDAGSAIKKPGSSGAEPCPEGAAR